MNQKAGSGTALARERARLLDFASRSRHPRAGFGWLNEAGMLVSSEGLKTYITARMTHVFSLGSLDPGESLERRRRWQELSAHGVAGLLGSFRDAEFGGWYAELDDDARPVVTGKQAYVHGFVALAASSALAADTPGAGELLEDVTRVLRQHFLDEKGRVIDTYDREFARSEPYRGANSSMHMVEALLAVSDALDEPIWHGVALGIAEHLIHGVAREHRYRLPEHFTADWVPVPDYNREHPHDPFRPFGSTPGHLAEWSRLLLHLEAALDQPPSWLVTDAIGLFEAAVESGWQRDGNAGFVYTADFDDQPVIRARLHWVLAECITAAAALSRRTGDPAYRVWYERWWAIAESYFIDAELGGWHHELTPGNQPSATIWSGKPDAYHAYQAAILPLLPLAPVAAYALAELGQQRIDGASAAPR